MDPVLSLSPSSPSAPAPTSTPSRHGPFPSASFNLHVRRSIQELHEQEEDLFGTFLKVAKNCLAFESSGRGIREDRDSFNPCNPCSPPPPLPLPHSSSSDSRLMHVVSSSSSSSNTNNTTNTKRVRKRHPATIQTPGRRIPTEEEAAVEPLTSTSSNTTPCTDVFDEELDEDHPFSSSSSHYHFHHEEELMILGKWEFEEEGFAGQNKDSPFEEEWFHPSENRIRTFSDAAKIEDLYQFPRKKLSNSLNGDIPVLTLYS